MDFNGYIIHPKTTKVNMKNAHFFLARTVLLCRNGQIAYDFINKAGSTIFQDR
jgi:hypothetical protein